MLLRAIDPLSPYLLMDARFNGTWDGCHGADGSSSDGGEEHRGRPVNQSSPYGKTDREVVEFSKLGGVLSDDKPKRIEVRNRVGSTRLDS